MNLPSTIGGNWAWRMTAEELNPAVEEQLYYLTKIYRRLNTDLIPQENKRNTF